MSKPAERDLARSRFIYLEARLREVERERDHERRVANSAFGKAEQYLQASKLLEQERDQARSELTTLREAVERARAYLGDPETFDRAFAASLAELLDRALASLDEQGGSDE